jgi:hypothetical protein
MIGSYDDVSEMEGEYKRWVGKVNVNVKLSLCFNWAPRHGGVLGEWKYSSIHSLTSALDGGEWSASRPGRFNSRVRALGTHWIGGWVDPRVILDAVVNRKIRTLEPRYVKSGALCLFQSLSRYSPGQITGRHESFNQDNRQPGRTSNQVHPKYKCRALHAHWLCVTCYILYLYS